MGSNSRDMQVTGLILIFFGAFGLISPLFLTTISSMTGIKIELLIITSICGVGLGIAFFVLGVRSREKSD